MPGDSNSTSTHWVAHPQSLAWIRQGRPGATEEWAWEELQRELLKAACGASEGVPIDKFRYPWAGRMVDLIVLLQNNHLTFANIWWQHVECNLDWLRPIAPAPGPRRKNHRPSRQLPGRSPPKVRTRSGQRHLSSP